MTAYVLLSCELKKAKAIRKAISDQLSMELLFPDFCLSYIQVAYGAAIGAETALKSILDFQGLSESASYEEAIEKAKAESAFAIDDYEKNAYQDILRLLDIASRKEQKS